MVVPIVPPSQINDDKHPSKKSETSAAASSPSSSHPKSHFVISMFEHINPTLVLQNSGSVARDHLASERTFLAYVRTSIGLAVAGVGIVQLFTVAELTSTAAGTSGPEVNRSLQRFGISLGVLALTFALFVLCFGVYRFFVVQRALPKNMFPAAQLSIVAISFVFGAIVVVLFAVLLTEKLAFFSAGVE